MSAAPAHSFPLPQPVDSGAPGQPATGGAERSFPKFFPGAAHAELLTRGSGAGFGAGGRAFDAGRYRVLFPERWAGFLQSHFRSVGEVGWFFGVDQRTAQNWWEGSNRPTGDKVALAAVRFPAGFADHMG